MPNKILLIALAFSILIGVGAYFYLDMDDSSSREYAEKAKLNPSDKITEENYNPDSDTDATAEANTSIKTDTAPIEASPVENKPNTTNSNTSNQASLDSVLSGFDSDTENYDDSGVDASFSGNLDESI